MTLLIDIGNATGSTVAPILALEWHVLYCTMYYIIKVMRNMHLRIKLQSLRWRFRYFGGFSADAILIYVRYKYSCTIIFETELKVSTFVLTVVITIINLSQLMQKPNKISLNFVLFGNCMWYLCYWYELHISQPNRVREICITVWWFFH